MIVSNPQSRRGCGFDTVSVTALEVSPVVLFRRVTLNVPAVPRTVVPVTRVLVPLAWKTHGDGVHPGPLKNVVESRESKFDPVRVAWKYWPATAGLGLI